MSAILKESISRVAELEEIFMSLEQRKYGCEERVSTYLRRSGWKDDYFGKEMVCAICTMMVQGATFLMEQEYGEWELSKPLQRGFNSRFSTPCSTNPDYAYPTSVEGVREAIEKMIEDCQQEQIEEYDSDTAWYVEHGYENPHEVHPWGDAVDAIRTWINQDEFVFFCIEQNLKEYAKSSLDDYIVDMTEGVDDGRELASQIKRHFETLMNRYVKAQK